MNLQYCYQVIVNVEVMENGGFLWQIVDIVVCVCMQRQQIDIVIINNDVVCIVWYNVYNYVESGGFIGIVWFQQIDNFFGVDGQVDVFYYVMVFIGFCKVFCS